MTTARLITTTITVIAALLLSSSPVASAASPPITRQAAAANAVFLAYAPPPPAAPASAVSRRHRRQRDPRHSPRPRLGDRAGRRHRRRRRPAAPRHDRRRDRRRRRPRRPRRLAATEDRLASARPTSPTPASCPSYQFDDYTNGITQCTKPVPGATVAAIDIPLSSMIPPTPDQIDEFADAVDQAQAKGIAILAAAGNEPGAIQLPGSQPGVLAGRRRRHRRRRDLPVQRVDAA